MGTNVGCPALLSCHKIIFNLVTKFWNLGKDFAYADVISVLMLMACGTEWKGILKKCKDMFGEKEKKFFSAVRNSK